MRTLTTAAACIAVLGGCMADDDAASIEANALESIVVQQEDVPRAFAPFDVGPLQLSDGPRGDSGWKARYRRAGTPETRGPLVIESRVDRVADAEAAAKALATVTARMPTMDWTPVDVPKLGDDAHGFGQREEAVTPVQYFMVAWRHANVVSSVTISGFAGKVTLEDALDLARAQQRRAAAAS